MIESKRNSQKGVCIFMGRHRRERGIFRELLGWLLYILMIVDKLTYHFKDPERFDIIVFPYKYEENTYYIKRIIGMPGETIQIIGGYVYINGQQLTSDIYGTEVMASAGIAAEPITLGADEYFVLGDNRNHSTDSREPNVGVLHREDLLGRAWVRIYPFDKIGVIQHE